MSTVPERLEAATATIEANAVRGTTDSNIQRAIVQGAADDADVTTENGPVKTLAKVVAEAETALATTLAEALKNRVTMPATSADPGTLGDYAVDESTDTLAIYFGTVWLFFSGFRK